jgi:glycosyltransferase involved in cell wall biosynthesis
MPKLSVVIIARDEERDLPRTLDALGFADELLVVDSGSVDRTVEVARSRGARVLAHAFAGFGPLKRWAVSQALHDWVLCVDADEVVTPELAAAIRELLAAGDPPRGAYAFRFVTVFMGRPLVHGPIARRRHVRLFDRRRARWTSAMVHEQVEVDGPAGELAGDVMHYTVRDISDSIRKMDAYSTLGATELARRGKRRGPASLLLSSLFQFLRQYLLFQHFRDGIPGLAWSLLNAVGSAMKHLKAIELAGEVTARPAALPAPERADLEPTA